MELRVIDFGRVSALRSQTLWHAIAYGVSEGAPPTLSFMTPATPYVSIGLHVNIDAVDVNACKRAGLPVFRRMVGGGPVYLDDDQLFFQITLPDSMAPAMRSRAVRVLLNPVVAAFQQIGIDAELDDANEIVVGDRKICGHAAGQIGSAVVVVGNLITGFNHDAAASIASTPNRAAAGMFRQMLERYVTAVDADPRAFMEAAVATYTEALSSLQGEQAGDVSYVRGRPPFGEPDAGDPLASLTPYELKKLEELDRKLADPTFIRGESRRTRAPWRIKVKSGVWVYGHANESATAVLGLVDDVITEVTLVGAGRDTEKLIGELVGSGLPHAADRIAREGHMGATIAQLVEAMT